MFDPEWATVFDGWSFEAWVQFGALVGVWLIVVVVMIITNARLARETKRMRAIERGSDV